MEATMTSKGQITIPAEIRRRLRLTPGTKLEFFINSEDHLEATTKRGSIKDLKGFFGKPTRVLTLEEMDEVIADGAAECME